MLTSLHEIRQRHEVYFKIFQHLFLALALNPEMRQHIPHQRLELAIAVDGPTGSDCARVEGFSAFGPSQ